MAKTKKAEQKTKAPQKLINIPSIAVYLLFVVSTAIFFNSQLFGDMFFWDDFVEYVYPTQTFAARAASDGIIPMWNPYVFAGMPFIADLQVGFFYPLNRLLSLFINPDGNLPVGALQFVIILHFLIAQITFYSLLKYWKTSSISAVIGAISYSFSYVLVLHVFHPMMIYHFAWFPLVVMFFSKGFDKRCIRDFLVAGLILGLTILSGHPQSTLYIFFFLGVYYVWNLISSIRNKESKFNINGAVGGILTILLAAAIFMIQYLPSQELADLSRRAEMTYEASAEGSLEYKQLLTAFMPKLFGAVSGVQEESIPFYLTISNSNGVSQAPYHFYWETGFYFGLAALFLGIVGFLNTKDKKRIFFLVMSILGILYALGDNAFIHTIFYQFPLFENFRNPVRLMLYASFGFSVVAAFGVDDLIKGKVKSKQLLIVAGIFGLILLLGVIGVAQSIAGTPAELSETIRNHALTQILIFVIIFTMAWLLLKNKVNPTVAVSIIAVFAFIDLYSAGSKFNQSESNPAEQYKVNQQFQELFKPNLPEEIFRVNTRIYNPSYMAMKRNQGMIDEFMLYEGYNPLLLERIFPDLKTPEEIHDVMNIKYELQIDQRSGRPSFVQNEDMMLRAWLVNKYEVFGDEDIEKELKSGDYNLRNTVILEEEPELPYSKYDSLEIGAVEIGHYGINEIVMNVNNQQNAILCLSEVWYPAWKVYINDKPTNLLRANYSLRAVEVPAGTNEVVFRYESEAYAFGSMISMLAVLGGLFGIVFLTFLKKKRK